MIGDKMYEAKGAEYFGSKGCLTCDLHETGYGCTNGKVVCYNPPRVFKEAEPNYCDCYEDYNDFEYMKWHEVLLLILILALPMYACLLWYKIKKLITKNKN
jgi:hypothetical protein